MCGVVAIWSPDGGLAAGDLTAPVRALVHRGPDGTGRWISPTGRAALGHTRLATIDLRTGDQPIEAENGRFQLIGNGEFYGYEAIRAELLLAGAPLRTRTDSEIAVALYAREGWTALHQLRGEFAFAIWDELRGELFAARDRFGMKPLFYAEHRGRLYLASEIKALLACGVPARWDVPAFAAHLLVSHPPDRSLFAGIRQLPPGCYLLAGSDGVRVHRYWDLDYPDAAEVTEPPPGWDVTGHLDAVAAAVEDAVRTRIRADVPVAYHLSGGIDSCTVVALAAAHSGRLPTFTVRFDEPELDESAVAGRTARRLGADGHEIFFSRSELARRIDEVTAAGEMIQENSHAIARLVQAERIHALGYKVVLAGEGGDEVFAGYPQFVRDLELGRSASARATAEAGYARLARHGLPGHMRVLIDELGFVPSWIVERYLTVTLPLLPLLRPEFAATLADPAPWAELIGAPEVAEQLRGRAPLHQSMYLFCKTWLCNYLLAAERLDMAHAVEVRLPFLDHHVLEVVKRTPLAEYDRGGVTKSVLRRAMRARLPDEVYAGPKQGFFAPPAVQSEAALARLRGIVADSVLGELPFFDAGKVRALFDRIAAEPPARRAGYERVVQIVSGACLLARTFGLAGPDEVAA